MLYLETRSRTGVVRWGLSPREYLLGRSRRCDLIVDDPTVSRQHLRIRVASGKTYVEDLGSRHGVWLDGSRVEQAELQPGVWFHAGVVPMVLREGISIGGGGSDHQTPSKPEARRTPEHVTFGASPECSPEGSSACVSLAGYLRGDMGPRELLLDLLEKVVCESGSRGGALVYGDPGGAGLMVETLWGGNGEAADLERALLSGETGSYREFFLPASELPGARLVLTEPSAGVSDSGILDLVASAWQRVRLSEGSLSASGMEERGRNCRGAPEGFGRADERFIAVSELGTSLLAEVDRLASTHLPVVLLGESGTGKELLAMRLHEGSERRSDPFVPLNCAALPRELLEAELFGIEKNVATGVSQRTGWFVKASGGTLFLDEIGDLPLSLQPKLLRVLETNRVLALGAREPIEVDVRIVAASHRPLRTLAKDGSFREDLLYRLCGAEIYVPALRDRPVDILPMAQKMARHAARERGVPFLGIDLEAARLLVGYTWPGNVRELKHAIERAAALAEGPILHSGLLPPQVRRDSDLEKGDLILSLRGDWRRARERFDKVYFAGLIEQCGGRLTEVSRIAGLSRSNLYRRLKELGLR